MFSVQSVPVCVQCTKWLFFKTLQLELKPRYYLCLIQHLPYNSIHFIFLLEKDLNLNSLSVIDLYLKSKFPDSTSPSKKKEKNEEHLTKYWNQTIWFSFLPVLLPWKEYIWSDLMSQRCVSPQNYWLLSRQLSCNHVWFQSLNALLVWREISWLRIKRFLILSGKTSFSASLVQFLPPSSTTNTHIHATPGTYHSFPRVLPRDLDYLAQQRVKRSGTKVLHSTKTIQWWFISVSIWNMLVSISCFQ